MLFRREIRVFFFLLSVLFALFSSSSERDDVVDHAVSRSWTKDDTPTTNCFCAMAEYLYYTMEYGTNIEEDVPSEQEFIHLPQAGPGTMHGPMFIFRDAYSAIAHKFFSGQGTLDMNRVDLMMLTEPAGVLYLNNRGVATSEPIPPRHSGIFPLCCRICQLI